VIPKYALMELERRFLLRDEPAPLDPAEAWRIHDRYVEGARLRLRRQDRLDGRESLYKLSKKEVPVAGDFSRVTIVSIYLAREEHTLLEGLLPGDDLTKRRYKLRDGAHVYSVDVFDGHLSGLVLAEINFETEEELDAHVPPAFAIADVSRDEGYTGAALAGAAAPPSP
jgi:CYTH domain-containing protein